MRILFLCTGNSCRSQMAEGWARHLKGDVIDSCSAGTVAKGLNPRAVEVMAEAEVDISDQTSKTVQAVMSLPFDYVVTVCAHAHETCPVFSGKVKVVHAGFDEAPELAKNAVSYEDALKHYRRIRDEIRNFIQKLPRVLTHP